MGARRIRREQRQVDQAQSRIINGHRKRSERESRTKRMIGLIKANKLPYIPSVMSWISAELKMPASRVTQQDVDNLLSRHAEAKG